MAEGGNTGLPSEDDSSLENESTVVENAPNEISNPDALTPPANPFRQRRFLGRFSRFFATINPYLVLFIAIIIVSIILSVALSRLNSDNATEGPTITVEGNQQLDQAALDDLLAQESTVGTIDQTLTVAANTIFNGKILVKDDLDVAGSINVGGPLSLPGITVAGTSSFDDVQVSNNLSILGGISTQGSVTIQQGINISGNAAVGGNISASSITTDSLQLSNDLALTRHIDTGGSIVSAASGSAVGAGGTVSVSGNDIAGTVTINTGGGPPAGIMARITFTSRYNQTPVVHITPVNSNTAQLDYYIERDSASFSIGSATSPNAATTYVFDYFVTE